jgi:hypothetical protein
MVWKVWLYHLVDAIVTGSSNAGLAVIIAPNIFNVSSAAGWGHLGEMMGGAALVQLLKYLSQGLPPIDPKIDPLKGEN